MCVCVCIYIYTHTYIHIYIHTHKHTHTHTEGAKKRIHIFRKEICNTTCLSHGDASIHLINAIFWANVLLHIATVIQFNFKSNTYITSLKMCIHFLAPLYVCVCVCVYIYIYVYCIYVCVCVYIYTHTHIYTVYIYMYTHTHIQYIYIHTHTYTVYIYIYIHSYTLVRRGTFSSICIIQPTTRSRWQFTMCTYTMIILCIVNLYIHFCDLKMAYSGRNMSSSA